jgi:hypothetical protein
MGLKNVPARLTLSDALNLYGCRTYYALAMRLITRARALYGQERLDIDLDATAYTFDATTIDFCLPLFDWAPFGKTKAAVKMHTPLDLRSTVPAFIHISNGKMHEVNVLDFLSIKAGLFTRRIGAIWTSPECTSCIGRAFFATRAKRNMNARRV